jgi:hypothetical protein
LGAQRIGEKLQQGDKKKGNAIYDFHTAPGCAASCGSLGSVASAEEMNFGEVW